MKYFLFKKISVIRILIANSITVSSSHILWSWQIKHICCLLVIALDGGWRLLLHLTAPAIYETWRSQSTGFIHGLVRPRSANQRLYKASLIECHTVNYLESFINICMWLLSYSFASSCWIPRLHFWLQISNRISKVPMLSFNNQYDD